MIEQEGKEEIAPVGLKLNPPDVFFVHHTLAKLEAVDDDVRHISTNEPRYVEPRVEPSLVLSVLKQGQVVLEVHDVVKHERNGVETFLREIVKVLEFQPQKEGIKIIIFVCLCKRWDQHLIPFIGAGLSQLGFILQVRLKNA